MNLLPTEGELQALYAGKRTLVTGAGGFVASHLIPRLSALGSRVFGVGRSGDPLGADGFFRGDLADKAFVETVVANAQPQVIFHLAGQSSIGPSWEREWETIEAALGSAFNLLSALERSGSPARVLLISSGEVYGDTGGVKARVDSPLRPRNPYAAAKVMVEDLGWRFQSAQLGCVIARPFNHTGPRRPERYFEAYVAEAAARSSRTPDRLLRLSVGNLENLRDYSDVRDVVEKYLWLAAVGDTRQPVNVCSGEPRSMAEVVALIAQVSGVKIEPVSDPQRFRRNDLPYLVGEDSMNWPRRSLEQTLADLYASTLARSQQPEAR